MEKINKITQEIFNLKEMKEKGYTFDWKINNMIYNESAAGIEISFIIRKGGEY